VAIAERPAGEAGKTNTVPLRHNDQWQDIYRGVRFEINKWRIGSIDSDDPNSFWMWNYYLIIPEEQVPKDRYRDVFLPRKPKHKRNFAGDDYDSYTKFIENLDFHGGCTWYSKLGGADRTPVCAKIGCDYGHLGDREIGFPYDVEWVADDARKTIDSLWEAIPNLRVRCSYNGEWYDLAEGFFTEHGEFSSHEGEKRRLAWLKEHAPPKKGTDSDGDH